MSVKSIRSAIERILAGRARISGFALRVGGVLAAFAFISYQGHRTATESGRQTAEALATVVGAYTEQILNSSAIILQNVQEIVKDAAVEVQPELRDWSSKREIFDSLRNLLRNAPQVDVISIVALDGTLLTYSRSYPPPAQNLGDRDYIAHARELSDGQVFLSDPVENKTNGNWTFYLAVPLRARSGARLGVAIVGLPLASLARFYGSLSLGSDNGIAFYKGSGTLLVNSRVSRGRDGTSQPIARPQRLFEGGPHPGSTIVRGNEFSSLSRSDTRIVAPRRLQQFAAFVVVVLGEEIYLRSWRNANLFVGTAAALVLIGMAFSYRRTSRLLAEQERSRRQNRTNDILSAAFEHPTALVAVLDGAGDVIFANDRFWSAFGNHGAADPGCLRRSDLVGATALLDFAQAGRNAAAAAREFEVEIETEAGRKFFRFSGAERVLPDIGRCTVLSGFDETERRQAEAALLQSTKLVMLGEMAAGVAHELNQPLFVISLAAQNAQHAIKVDASNAGGTAVERNAMLESLVARLTESFGRILAQVARATTIVQMLRQFGRSGDLDAAPFDVGEACNVAIGIVREQLRLAGVTIEVDISPDPLVVQGMRNALEQVIVNLLLNARDALQANEAANRKVLVNVRRDRATDEVQLRVIDNGPGIRPDLRTRIFDPFFTTKAAGKGMGLGLALAYRAVRDMKGTLKLLPDNLLPDGRGAAFEISLPRLH